jgi:hypothetical protein
MTGDFPESRIVQIWQDCPGRADLATEEGGPVQILYPGRINDDSGADFRDAVMQTSQGRLTGDIEIHVKSSSWWAHRHHRDPRYNRVILHVVFRHDTAEPARLENGHKVPTLVLERLFPSGNNCPPPRRSPVPCLTPGKAFDIGRISAILDVAGEQRFQSRAAGFQTVGTPVEAGQVLYRGILAALGYARNKHPMLELAGRMPLRRLEAGARPLMPDTECLAWYQAMLTGAAGLLPSRYAPSRGDGAGNPWTDRLQKIWAASGEPDMMSVKDWHFFRVRPGNFPARRLAAMSRLLVRYREEGLLSGLLGRLDILPEGANHRELEDALTIEAERDRGYPEGSGRGDPALLGRARAAAIIINVILPFVAAWGRVNCRPGLAEKALNLYHRYPALATNTIERHMSRQLGLNGHLVNSARRQQGLLHLFQARCSLGGCPDCPVNGAL